MFWEEDKKNEPYQVSDKVQDVNFKVNCKVLPLDHAHELSLAIHKALPWLEQDEISGIHQIHGAESGNGWLRPEDTENEFLHLSKRARFSIRTPKERIEDVLALSGQILDVAGYALELGKGSTKLLSTQSEQFSRYVIAEAGEQEEMDFLQRVVDELRDLLGSNIRKVMCGKPHKIQHPDGEIMTRSLMVADLDPDTAVKLQQYGIGRGRKLGCGLFLPHKGIKAVGETEDKSHFTGAK